MGEVKDETKDKPRTEQGGKSGHAPDVTKGGDGKDRQDGTKKPAGDGKTPDRQDGTKKPEGGDTGEKPKGGGESSPGRRPEYDVTKKNDSAPKPKDGQQEGQKDAPKLQDSSKKELSDDAKKIIKDAKDTSKPIEDRAKNAVKDIIKKYYPDAKIKDVVYKEQTKGLQAERGNKDGKITVGKDFVDNIDKLNNRITQVGHELTHVQQYKDGMNNKGQEHEREFKAHEWSAHAPNREGGPSMSHTDRANHAQEALREYGNMPKEDQKKHEKDADALRKFEAAERKAGGR